MSLKKRRPRGIPILGYTTRRHLLIDLDNSTLEKTRRLAQMIMDEWPKVGDCLIVRSSEGETRVRLRYTRMGRPLQIYKRDNYHMIFDNGIGYNASCRICRTLALIGILNKDYVRIREFRGDMTLRVGTSILYAGNKPAPLPITYIRNKNTKRRDGWMWYYLRCLRIAHRLFLGDLEAEEKPDHGGYGADDSREIRPVQLVEHGVFRGCRRRRRDCPRWGKIVNTYQ